MTYQEKTAVIEELTAKLANCPNFYLCDATGMTVAQTNDFRRLCFERGLEYKVYKNTLIKKALEKNGLSVEDLGSALKGFSGVIFSPENAKAPAQLLKDFYAKGVALPLLKGASIDTSAYVGANQLDILVKIKSKQELLGEVIGLLQSPAKNVVSALTSSGSKLAGLLKALEERQAA